MALPTLILIHGYPFDHTMWKTVALALDNKTKIITPDLPGFGDNPTEAAEPSIDLMADDIVELLDFHNTRQAVVSGMSMGGYVALAFAQRHPERLAGLALISTQSAADTDEARQNRRNLIQKIQHEGVQAGVDAILPKMYSDANVNNAELRRFPIEGADNAGVEGLCWALEAMARRPDRTAVLSALNVPALVLHGTEDKIFPIERARQMAEKIQDSKFVEAPSAGHATPLEAPQIVADALLDLLAHSEKYVHSVGRHPKREEPGIIVSPTNLGL